MVDSDASKTEETVKDEGTTKVAEVSRPEVSAHTITRMMGIPTATDLKLLEGKIEFVSTKINGVVSKVERILTMLNSMPTAGDMDRMELQLGAIKALVREVVDSVGAGRSANGGEAAEAAEQGRKIRAGIKSSKNDQQEVNE